MREDGDHVDAASKEQFEVAQAAPESGGRPASMAPLMAILREVLGLADVGADDTFLALGGGSLAGMRLASRVRERFGIKLPLTILFGERTVRDIAAHIDSMSAGAEGPRQ